jgi:hypothetical protein
VGSTPATRTIFKFWNFEGNHRTASPKDLEMRVERFRRSLAWSADASFESIEDFTGMRIGH